MKIIEKKDRAADLIQTLLDVWEKSVRTTHLFLLDSEINSMKEYVSQALSSVQNLIIAQNDNGRTVAFMGIENHTLEMLFISPEEHGKGLGKALIFYGIEHYEIQCLTVNEQNPDAKGFFEHMGFQVYKRTETNERGNPYPLLYMKRNENVPELNLDHFQWIRPPKNYSIQKNCIRITTEPHTDLWQRTYYHFRNDNPPVLQMETDEKFFSFIVKTDFTESSHRFDQCGIVMYLDSENWLKGSIEFENEEFQHLGSVVTNHGYSDWATTEISAQVKTMWYRFSRRQDDYCIECSPDGTHFSQMRVCHMWEGSETIRFGIYACSPEDSSFTAVFTHMELTECKWMAHDGQQPDA